MVVVVATWGAVMTVVFSSWLPWWCGDSCRQGYRGGVVMVVVVVTWGGVVVVVVVVAWGGVVEVKWSF